MSDVPDKPGSGRAPELRASDADRDRVAAVIREAAAEGRLGLDEVDERLSAVYSARTYGELARVTVDLPATDPFADDRPAAASGAAVRRYAFGGAPTSTAGIGILGGFRRRGGWTVPRAFTAVCFMGGGELDLREARYAEREVTIRVYAFMGGAQIIVPEDAEVQVNGLGIMGGFDDKATGRGAPGAPRIIVSGVAVWGGASIERRPHRTDRDGDRRERD